MKSLVIFATLIYSSFPFFLTGIKVCCVFSLSGVVFLSIIGAMLLSNTIYLKVNEKNSNRKPALAEGVFGAICIYLAIFGWTLFLWLRSSPCLYGIFRSNKRFEL